MGKSCWGSDLFLSMARASGGSLPNTACSLLPTDNAAVPRRETEPAVCSWPRHSPEQQGLQQNKNCRSLLLKRLSPSKPAADVCHGRSSVLVIEVQPHHPHFLLLRLEGSSALPVKARGSFKSRNTGKCSSRWKNS